MKPYQIEFRVTAFCEANAISPQRIEEKVMEHLTSIVLDDYVGDEPAGRDVFGYVSDIAVTDHSNA